jgi:hypothetical protein
MVRSGIEADLEKLMTKRARAHFRVAEFADGQPWIVMEHFDGERLSLFEKSIGYDLRQIAGVRRE